MSNLESSRKNVTMADVAKAAGVHQTTVSLALRRHPGIPDATRERILTAAHKLGYRPNPLVAALMGQLRNRRRKQEGEVIAYLTNFRDKSFWKKQAMFLAMFEGASKRAGELGFTLQEFNMAERGMNSTRILSILQARGIRSLVIAPLPDEQTELDLDVRQFAVVALGVSLQSPKVERIANDHYQSMQIAFRECVKRGYKRIGFIIGRAASERLEERWLAAFLHGQCALHASQRIPPLLLHSFLLREVRDDIAAWMKEQVPDVVVIPLGGWQEDWHAMLVKFTQNRTLGVVNLSLPPNPGRFAGIQQNAHKIGEIAIERVVARLQHNDQGPLSLIQNTMLHGEWHDGETLPPNPSR